MQCAVERFVNQKKNGLCLIDMPTGTGKTHLTAEIIEKYIKGEALQGISTIIYLTPQKKNIDDIFNKIKARFSTDPELFEKNALRIPANYENVLDKFLRIYESISPSLRSKDACKELKKQIELYKQLSSSGVPKDILDGLLIKIRNEHEIAFRKAVSEELFDLGKTLRERERKLNGEYAWVKELYPACLTDKRKVLFMTVDKFLTVNDPIISKPYRFISHSKTKGALVFIDEFDSTKDILLNQEIQKCADYKMDLIRLFSSISNTLKGRQFPNSIFADSADENDTSSSLYRFNKLKQRFLEVEKEYNLNYVFKLESRDDGERYFIFDDYQLHTVTNANKDSHIVINADVKKKQNTIAISTKSDGGRFYRTIYAIKNAINSFIRSSAVMAKNYLRHYNEEAQKTNRDMMELEQAVSTIVDLYNLDNLMAKDLSRMIVDNISIPDLEIGKDPFDTDFYMYGFRYYDFKDDISHDASTTMAMCYMENTPEKFMLSLAKKSYVVGLSATASLETVTGNYNIEYLKDRLGTDFYTLDSNDRYNIKKYIEERLEESLKKLGDINVSVQKIEDKENESLEPLVSQLFSSEENIERFVGVFNKYRQENNPNFNIVRMLKLMSAIKEFVQIPSSKALLLMTNRNVSGENHIFSKNNIEDLIEALCNELGVQIPKIHYLSSADFISQKDQYKKDVASGNRVLIFSSYNTAGTGQNLQYEIDDVERDIDSIYLEKPTNIIVNSRDLKEEQSLLKFIYQYEALKNSGEIAQDVALKNIKSSFKKFMKQSAPVKFDTFAYQTESANNHALKILIQATGRICRTKNKNDTINIYVDESIVSEINFSPVLKEGVVLNPEFRKIAELNQRHGNGMTLRNLNKACERNARTNTRIESMLSANRVIWREEDVLQWNSRREFVLKYPTISKADLSVFVREQRSLKDFYLDAPEGMKIDHYLFDDAIDNTRILYDFDVELRAKCKVINQENSRLTKVVKIPEVRKEFEKNGYAMVWQPNDAIILPVVYQNIYKGALGEVAGKAILQSLGIKLTEITDATKFEKFDFCLEADKDIYIDFKNWSEYDRVPMEEYRKKCIEKLDKIQGKRVFVVNLVSSEFIVHKSFDSRIVEVSTLCDIKKDGEYFYKISPTNAKKLVELFAEEV